MSRQGYIGPAGNEQTQARLRDQINTRERQFQDDLRDVMHTPAGRRFMWSLLFDRCELLTKGILGPEGIKRMGRQDLGIDLNNELLEATPEAYEAMQAERRLAIRYEQTHRKAALSAANEDPDE